MKRSYSEGIQLKKHHGQYFLRDTTVIHDMISAVTVKDQSIFEIGCGDGFLTREIIANDPARLWVFEIDKEWAEKVDAELEFSKKLTMHHANFLDIDFSVFEKDKPWTLLSNLPYHVTFPILKRIYENKHHITQGVIMVQEEVGQKIVKTHGRGYGYISLFYQRYFEWELLTKVPPTAFYPQPKVYSRLMHFVARKDVPEIKDEPGFWKFIKYCFSQPRRTLRNNLAQTHLDLNKVEKYLSLRAQQMSFDQLLEMWTIFN